MFLVVLMSIDGFAAVVSDNDGVAFITKAEYDSMKNTFQSQINEFNSGIDDKISTAIDRYLSGVRAGKTIKAKTIHSDWEDIEFLNYEIKPNFNVPNYSWVVTASWWSNLSSFDKKMAVVGGFRRFDRTWSTNQYNLRPLASIIYGTESQFGTSTFKGKVAWNGCASRWIDEWAFNKYGYGNCYNMTGNTNYRVWIQYPFTFGKTGYIKGAAVNTLLPVKPRFQDGSDSGGWAIAPRNTSNNREDLTYQNYEGYYDFSITLGQLENGETSCHKHIITDASNTTFWLSNETFNNLLTPCSDQTIDDKATIEVIGSRQFINGLRNTFNQQNSAGTGASSYTTAYIGTIAFSYDNGKLPLIGLLPYHYTAGEIYQEAYEATSSGTFLNRELTWNEKTIRNAPQLTLQNGMEVCISEKNKSYEWELEFEKIVLGSNTNQNEVDIYLSKVPFGSGVSTSGKIKLKVGDNEYDYVTTTNRKAKFKWTVTDDATVVYMKCRPHYKSGDSTSANYTITLDNENSGTVIVTS